jgi:hypothetical protein
MSGNNNTLPNFIKARSAKALRVSMIKNNVRLKMSYVDYHIVYDGKNWYAWYNEPIWENEQLKKEN